MAGSPEIWVLIAFVVFGIVAWRPLARTTRGVLDERIASIRGRLERAAQLRAEAETLLASLQRRHRDVAKEADAIVTNARLEAKRYREAAVGKLEESSARRRALLEGRFARSTELMMKQVHVQAGEAVMAAAALVLAERLDEEAHWKVVLRTLTVITPLHAEHHAGGAQRSGNPRA